MNLKAMFEAQKKFDALVVEKHGLQGVNLLPKKILALQVEVAEMCAEWRGFKYWSKDQAPRTEVFKNTRHNGNGVPMKKHNPLLEEYVDCLHFLLSVAHDIGLEEMGLYTVDEVLQGETEVIFTELMHNVGMVGLVSGGLLNSMKYKPEHASMFFRSSMFIFINLGIQRFGFTFEQIEKAYYEKNAENYARQERGY